MTVQIGGKACRLGLALSGGGFRAAAFHLGVFRKLHALRLLDKVDLISCVSGGSIAGAFLALNWGKPDALDRLERYLTSRSIAVASVIGGLLEFGKTRIERLAESYDDDLFDGATLSALKQGPRIYLNATNLATGNLFFFVAGGGGPEEIGEHELGAVLRPDLQLSRAVAASSAFPPVFDPLTLTKDEYPPQGDVEYVTLTDGGVYDNLGVNPLFRKRNELSYAIVSGKPFDIEATPTSSGPVVLTSAIGILMEQVRGLQFDRLLTRHAGGAGPKPVWFSIDSQEGQANVGDPELASLVGTNLKKLSSVELELLTRHGGALCEARLKKYCPELVAAAGG
jgi:NTE family protein